MGLGAIMYSEIAAWSDLYKVDIGPWEVSIIDTIDSHFRSISAEKNDPDAGKGTSVQDAARDAEDLRNAIAAKRERERKKDVAND